MNLMDKIIWREPGVYLLAVSGGVDSMVMLDLFAGQRDRGYELTVGFIDHGWRNVASERDLVRERCSELGIKLLERSLTLSDRSEATARRARHAALAKMQSGIGALAVLTAHHLDDRIETVVMNLQRGTGRRGLAGQGSDPGILRPLANVRRAEIEEYARHRGLMWIEDPTNQDLDYRRNQIRHETLPQLRSRDHNFDQNIIDLMNEASELNITIDSELLKLRQSLKIRQIDFQGGKKLSFNLTQVNDLSTPSLTELILYLIKQLNPKAELDSLTLQSLANDIKTGHIKRRRNLTKRLSVQRQRDTVTIAFAASQT